MADKNVGLTSSDIFSLGGNWVPQSSNKNMTAEYASMLAANGDFVAGGWSELFNNLYGITASYKWKAITGLGAAIPNIGSVANSYLITEISVATNQKDWPTISFTGHQHKDNEHIAGMSEYAIPADIIALLTGKFGAYDFLNAIADVTSAEDICVMDSTYTITLNHVDAECTGGEHWVGENLQGKETVSETLIGRVTLPASLTAITGPWLPDTANAWWPTAASNDDSNTDFNKSVISAERRVYRV